MGLVISIVQNKTASQPVYDQYSFDIGIGRYIGIGQYIGFADKGNVLSVLVSVSGWYRFPYR